VQKKKQVIKETNEYGGSILIPVFGVGRGQEVALVIENFYKKGLIGEKNKILLEKAYDWAVDNNSFVGNAQNISHTQMRNHIFASQSCLIITKNAWNALGSPDFSWFIQNGMQIDTSQIITLRADQIGMSYQLMYPIGYDEDNHRSLGGYGMYGTGTLYPATWHYFRISELKKEIPELWTKRVNNILNNQKIIPHYSSCFYGL
jgi:hypothetical protein